MGTTPLKSNLYSTFYGKPSLFKHNGFTLVELVIVIVMLGILSVGVTSFLKLGSEMFVDVKNRSEMIASARFSIERLNRELRSALPNSVIASPVDGFSASGIQCIQYTPIITTAHYLDVPTSSANEAPTNTISVVEFNTNGIDFNGVNDIPIIVYPTSAQDSYDGSRNKLKIINNAVIDNSLAIDDSKQWNINFTNTILFIADSPTERLFFIDNQVNYCVKQKQLKRFVGLNITDIINSSATFNNSGVLMATDMQFNSDNNEFPFKVSANTQSRNSTALIKLIFEKNNEAIVFNNEVHIPNAP